MTRYKSIQTEVYQVKNKINKQRYLVMLFTCLLLFTFAGLHETLSAWFYRYVVGHADYLTYPPNLPIANISHTPSVKFDSFGNNNKNLSPTPSYAKDWDVRGLYIYASVSLFWIISTMARPMIVALVLFYEISFYLNI